MGHLNSRLLWHKYAKTYFEQAEHILEIGPAGNPTPYEAHVKKIDASVNYQLLDIRTNFISGAEANPNFIYATDPLNYPIASDTYDIVFSDQVLAHVEQFWKWYEELKRITKKGGYIITINSYSYPSCPSPFDAWRVHADGMKILNSINGLETILCTTESVEMEKFNISKQPGHYFPGASFEDPFNSGSSTNLIINRIKQAWNGVVGHIPKARGLLLNPVSVSFDTITIARK